jgi:hypothetical protein
MRPACGLLAVFLLSRDVGRVAKKVTAEKAKPHPRAGKIQEAHQNRAQLQRNQTVPGAEVALMSGATDPKEKTKKTRVLACVPCFFGCAVAGRRETNAILPELAESKFTEAKAEWKKPNVPSRGRVIYGASEWWYFWLCGWLCVSFGQYVAGVVIEVVGCAIY